MPAISALDNTQPLLPQINTPADLRKLSVDQLPQVCNELRAFMIERLSENPGHFASSMGSVELTVALHYVFDTPEDRIVWDVGHQAYSHKILTGRRDRFHTQRTYGGLSGFPTPSESEYDTFTAGHASNSISAALGMAVADSLSGSEKCRNVVAVIGDASISGGLAFEGINNAANIPNNLLIVLNDNDMSIDKNVGSLNSYLAHLTTSKAYNNLRMKAYGIMKKMHLVTERRRGSILRFNNSLKSLLTRQQNIFEGLNLRYFGPFDGHDVKRIVRVLQDIRDMKGPRILHLRTIKGKGFSPAENDPCVWHAPGKFDPATGERKESVKKDEPPKFQDVFGQTLLEFAREDKKIVGITAAMPSGTSISVMQKEIPERVFDVGISEGHAVTFAGGLAKEGMKPFVAIYSSFLQRAYDHIIHDVAIQKLPVVFCIDRAGVVGEDGVTHHGAFDLAYLRAVPNIIIAAPRDEHLLRNLMFTAKDAGMPFAIRYPRGKGSNTDWHNTPRKLEIGKGDKLLESSSPDIAILAVGTSAIDAYKASLELANEGIKANVYDMVFVKPLDEGLLREVADLKVPVITVEDGCATGGLGGAVTEWFAKESPGVGITRLGIPDNFVTHGSVPKLKEISGYDTPAIVRTAKDILSRSQGSTTSKKQ